MHKNAVDYDLARGVDNRFGSKSGLPRDPKDYVPENRPCDWCGGIVKKGYIHNECLGKEADSWLDILY